MKIEIKEYWIDKDKPQVISYDSITQAIRRMLQLYDNAGMSEIRDELIPKAELTLYLKKE